MRTSRVFVGCTHRRKDVVAYDGRVNDHDLYSLKEVRLRVPRLLGLINHALDECRVFIEFIICQLNG